MTPETLVTLLQSLHQMLVAVQTEISPLTTVEPSLLHAAEDLLDLAARQFSAEQEEEEEGEADEPDIPPAQVVLMAFCECSNALDELDGRTTFAEHRRMMYGGVLSALDDGEATALRQAAAHLCARLIWVLGRVPAPEELPDA